MTPNFIKKYYFVLPDSKSALVFENGSELADIKHKIMFEGQKHPKKGKKRQKYQFFKLV